MKDKIAAIRKAFIFIFVSLITFCTSAQERWFEITAGPAFSFASKKNDATNYDYRIVPQGGISGFFSFNKRVALKTGILYQLKGLKTNGESINSDTVEIRYAISSQSTYHYINVPLQLAINLNDNAEDQWRIAAGMSYGFMIAARTNAKVLTYNGDDLIQAKTISWHPKIGTAPKDNYPGLPAQEGTSLYLFTPSARIDLTYQWQERLLISAFYEYSLQDTRVRTVGTSKLNLHYVGISFGVRFW